VLVEAVVVRALHPDPALAAGVAARLEVVVVRGELSEEVKVWDLLLLLVHDLDVDGPDGNTVVVLQYQRHWRHQLLAPLLARLLLPFAFALLVLVLVLDPVVVLLYVEVLLGLVGVLDLVERDDGLTWRSAGTECERGPHRGCTAIGNGKLVQRFLP
jgi:hypothetical protein